ncbi:hypothetical protein [Pseudomonas aeruginosa]|uniref:hypothetical protein n=1 Tax=Pseudomonas aeruginosa TaxID=287 RepID=UPI000AE7EBDB|nr:hypothetical protein [Pseudomonas aeruginosa]
MTNALPPGLTDCLLWSEELGMGFHPRPPMDYTGPYFEKYQLLDATPMGAALTQARIDLVRRHLPARWWTSVSEEAVSSQSPARWALT